MFKKALIPLLFLLFTTQNTLAFDQATTHPALTQEIINAAGGITAEQASWIMEGSRAEDNAPRWVNHFYDPVNNTGWTGAKAGDIPQETLRTLTEIGMAGNIMSAPDWAVGCNTQTSYVMNGGMHTWDNAIAAYLRGDMKNAYLGLGHILHLAEDMGVPDHTRDDTHAQAIGNDGSPFEQYATRWTAETIKNLKISEFQSNLQPSQNSNVRDYLIQIANYSNKYFFSKDTIKDPKYSNPQITAENSDFAYGKDENGTEFPIAKVDSDRNSVGNGAKSYSLKYIDKNIPIFDSYFIRLSKQIVTNGAGIVRLFKKQASDAATNNKDFFVDERHALKNAACAFGEKTAFLNISPMGLLIGAGNAISSATGQVADTAGSVWNFFAGLFKKSTPQPTEIADNAEETGSSVSSDIQNSPAANTNPTLPPIIPPPPKPTAPKTTTTLPVAPTSTLPASTTTTATSTASGSSRLALSQPPMPPPPKPTTPGYGPTGGGGGTVGIQPAATSTDTQTTTTPPSLTDHILISEIFFNADGSDTGKEFVELYNPTDSAKDLDDYSLKYTAENSTTTHSLATIRATTTEISVIPAHGFLLFGFGGYDSQNYGGRAADITRTASIPNGEDIHNTPQKIELGFFDKAKQKIDSVIYDKNSITAPGESLERLAFDGACRSATGSGEFIGNGCSTGEKQFESKNVPRPQNSASFPEPRQAPTAPTPLEGASSIANYFPDTLKINFTWKDSLDFSGSSTDIAYSLFDTSSSTPLLISTSTAISTEINIGEVGRSYSHSLTAEDWDGMPSATTSVSTEVPGFADKIFFYRDPRASSASGDILLELRYSNREFIPRILSNGLGWRGLLFYLDRMPNSQNGTLLFGRNYAPQNNDGVISVTARGPALFGLSPENSKGFGPGLYNFSFLLPEEDGRLVLGATLPSGATSTDYASVAYYDAINTGGIAFPAGENDFGLIATDARKIIFSETPPEQTPPTKPEAFSVNFDDSLSKLNLSWSTSTDADSPDSEITYETNFSTSTEFSSSTWVSSEKNILASVSVVFGNNYLLGVRAKDDFGNASEVNTLNWSFPADSRPPAEPIIGYFREDSCARTTKQITPTANIKIKAVEFSASCFNGNCDPPNDFAIYDENKTSLLSHSDGASRFGYPNPVHVNDLFSGENSITLLASTTYSVIPRSSNGDCGIGGTEEQSRFIITGSQP